MPLLGANKFLLYYDSIEIGATNYRISFQYYSMEILVKLNINRPFLSLIDLPQTTLPSFTVVTGINGAGKSHLLKALMNGAVTTDIAPNLQQDIRLFDLSNLAPQNEPDFDASTLRNEQVNLYNHLKSNIDQNHNLPHLFTIARNSGLTGSKASDPAFLASASAEELNSIAINPSLNMQNLRSQLDQHLMIIKNNLYSNLAPAQRATIDEIIDSTGRSLISLRYDDFIRVTKPSWGQTDLFQQSFARLFVAYREIYQVNRLAQMEKAEVDPNTPALSQQEFVDTYGPAPWDFVNASLQAAGMDFKIDGPNVLSFGPYRPRLHKRSSEVEINFDGLSSGERVLMSFAFAVYYAQDSRQVVNKPKLLLLDEVDAPLHPSMCKSLIATIENVLVKQLNLSVIMVTHSPSTVALTPEDAIYVMKPGASGLFKVGKDAALKDLTAGVPTLSLSYDGRRQIFVESPKDVEIYQSLYNTVKTYIGSEITPNFIATGIDKGGLHINNGCDVVKRIVSDLRAAGAKHTVGLLDWDGRNTPQDGIFILAENNRNGLESLIYDPLILLSAVVRHIGYAKIPANWPQGFNYTKFTDLDTAFLQGAIDVLQTQVLGRSRSVSISVDYLGGFSLEVDQEYLLMDDHALDDLIMKTYPELNVISRGRSGELMKWIVSTVLPERVDYIPKIIVSNFENIVSI
ncbi:AAA family ATPase [Methylobacterium sp. NEAU 140]|uniref:AAA family ATPase n=1 Tax=Methylobacterium sp. NEAU 140 TaxID=3064945 RepID=UPI0027366DA3|nr:AAA family ATPase [Methylobacterium sp. NEAU 140]MDP4021046.1 AAA family ATPase [Methylobacterium sp. NEAU 140]